MSQNNSNNDFKQENQHQPNFIPLVLNSDCETGRKVSGKAGDSPEQPTENVAGKAKYAKPSPKKKVLKQKKKSRKRRLNASSSSESKRTERKRRKKKRSGRKGKRNSPSSSSNVSSTDFTTDVESDLELEPSVQKRFKVILKGEEFKWNLPTSIIEYANHHFNFYITDKDIEKELLTENPVPSNLQQVKNSG